MDKAVSNEMNKGVNKEMNKELNRQKIIDFVKIKEDDLDSPVYDYILGLLDDESGEVSDADIITALKKNNIDKLLGYNAVFGDDALSDAPTNISSNEYDAYVNARRPTESSKQKYGQRKIDETLKNTKDEIEQRKKDVKDYETIGFNNPYVDEVRNIVTSYKLKNYDVKSKIDEYMQTGLTKEAAIAKVRKDIQDIGNRKPSLSEKMLGVISGLGRYLFAPAMYNDYYIETGKAADAEAMIRAGLGTGLNIVELTPYGKTITKPTKAAVIAAKPAVESVRQNIIDTDDAKYGQAATDALTGIGVNALLNLPAEAVNIMKQTAGLGPVVEKLPPVKTFFEGIEESAKVGRNYKKEHEQATEAVMKKLNLDPAALKRSQEFEMELADDLKKFARKSDNVNEVNVNEVTKVTKELRRLGYDEEANYISDILINPEDEVYKNTDFGRFKLGSYFDESFNPAAYIDRNKRYAEVQEKKPSLVILSRSSDSDMYSDMLDKAAEQVDLATIRHPMIANATVKGYIGSGVKAARNILDDEDYSYSEVKPYIENIKNDDLALRMWKAGFRPKNLTNRQIEYIDEEISR